MTKKEKLRRKEMALIELKNRTENLKSQNSDYIPSWKKENNINRANVVERNNAIVDGVVATYEPNITYNGYWRADVGYTNYIVTGGTPSNTVIDTLYGNYSSTSGSTIEKIKTDKNPDYNG